MVGRRQTASRPGAGGDFHAGTTVLVSAASVWEIATKYRLGKWDAVGTLLDEFEAAVRRSRFVPLMISLGHARMAGGLAHPHRDPFDRMLAAQSRHEDAALVSGDPIFTELGVTTVWTRQPGIAARA